MENLLEILASPKQVGILLGAGVSKACGLPNVFDLTKEVRAHLTNKNYTEMLEDYDTVEGMLNKLHQLKQLLTNHKKFNNLSLNDVIIIEKDIKRIIYKELSQEIDHQKLCSLVSWLNYINKDFEKEIFTLNYDLLLEKALEELNMPYFTGFVGNVNPFFISDTVDDYNGLYVKKSWIKLWKLHGSLNYKKTNDGKIIVDNNLNEEYEKMLVYPSIDKYLSSRKAPFVAYMDRFRKYLLENEKILFILGYSFNDEHVNEIIINGINNNARLSIFAFAYDEETYQRGLELFKVYPNISFYTDKKKYTNRIERSFDDCPNMGDFNNFVGLLDSLINNNTSICDEKRE